MPAQLNLALLQEYVQTLTNGDVSFPGIRSRPWGHEFSKEERVAVFQSLKIISYLADPRKHNYFVEQLGATDESTNNLHWLVANYGHEVSTIMAGFMTDDAS